MSTTTKKLTPAKTKDLIVKILKDNKAIDISALNIKKLTDIADYMIICTGNSTTHVKSLADKVCKQLSLEKIKPLGVEGEESKEWMLADFGDVIVHVMLATTREFYKLEKLWGLSKIKERAEAKD